MSGLRDDRHRWEARWAESDVTRDRPPSRWILERCDELAPSLLITDIACGAGRHAIPIARTGRSVVALDFVERAVAVAGREPNVWPVVADTAALPLRDASLDAILCVNYLERPLFAVFERLLRPGGFLIYETYTVAHLALVREGRARAPRNPAYTLEPGELRALVAPLDVLDYHEGLVHDDAGERAVARVVARKHTLSSPPCPASPTAAASRS